VTKGGNDGTPDAGRSVSVDAGLASADDASATQGAPGTGISVSIDAAGADGGGSGASATSNSNDEPKGSSNGGCQIAAGRGASSATGLFAMTLLALGASVLRRRGPSAQRAR
jgi:MYXO-CTERM domain-containing protein